MRKFLAAIFFSLLLCTGALGQEYYKNLNNALRFIKVGNTLRESQQYDLSEKYLNQGLQLVRSQNDKYWEAAAYENLALLYRDQENHEESVRYFNKALLIYRNLKMSLSEKAVEQLMDGFEGKEVFYAGIDIGAKGVKLSIISIKLNTVNEYEYQLKADTTINSEPVSLTEESQRETAEAIRKLLEITKTRHGIPLEKTFVVVSSGLRGELDKYHKLDEFITAITPAGATNFKIESVTPSQEGELTVLGTVPPKRRYTTSTIDVGSGNTKGGYYVDVAQPFEPFSFPLGTKTFEKMIRAKNPANIEEFAKIAERMWQDDLLPAVRAELSRKPGLRNRANMYLSGGIVWSIASYLYPEKLNNNYIELSGDDIARFKQQVIHNYEQLSKPNISMISDDELQDAVRKNLLRVQNTFDQQSLIAGSVWLDGLIKELNSSRPVKRLFFPKYAYIGWISGYVVKLVADDYKKKNETTN